MAWIESHQALGHHPKTVRLSSVLRCSLPTAVGHLQYLWWWALDYAPDGLVAADDTPTIARACEWKGKPERFIDALMNAGFIEDTGVEQVLKIHDWMDYAGKLVDQRALRKESNRKAQSARRQRLRQQEVSAESAPDVSTRQQSTGPDQPDRTGPTGPDQPVSPVSHSSAAAAAAPGPDTDPESANNPARARLLAEHLKRIDQERLARSAAAAAAQKISFETTETTNGNR